MSVLGRARAVARRFGLEVHRHDRMQVPALRLAGLLGRLGVDLVVDVGANDGGFVRDLRAAGHAGAVLSFEPLAAAHQQLTRVASGDAAWQVAPRCALGAEAGLATLHVAANSVSSSLLAMLPAHLQAAPDSAEIGSEAVPVRRLDDVRMPGLDAARRLFIKIDTQGFELPVLEGAGRTLERCVALQLELSLRPLYQGQALWQELLQWLGERGFEVWDLVSGFRDPADGRLLQFDGVLVRRGAG
jgi:FkbM family methyltransferase